LKSCHQAANSQQNIRPDRSHCYEFGVLMVGVFGSIFRSKSAGRRLQNTGPCWWFCNQQGSGFGTWFLFVEHRLMLFEVSDSFYFVYGSLLCLEFSWSRKKSF